MGTTRQLHDTKNKCRFDLDKSCFGDVFETDRYDLPAARENGALDLLLLNAYRRTHTYQPDGTFDYVQRVAKRLKAFLDKCDWQYELVVDGDLEVEDWGQRQAWPVAGTVLDSGPTMKAYLITNRNHVALGVVRLPIEGDIPNTMNHIREEFGLYLGPIEITDVPDTDALIEWAKGKKR